MKAKERKRRKALYGISRVDDATHHTHAWRVSLRRKGQPLVRNFPDLRHGGKRKALEAAKAYRDELLQRYPPLSRVEFAETKRRNNKSGVTGVCLVDCKYYLKSGRKRVLSYWEAIWPTATGHCNKRFSIARYGDQGAFQMACRARRRGLQALEGVFWACDRETGPDEKRRARKPAAKRVSRVAKKSAGSRVTKAKTTASKTPPRRPAKRRKAS